MENNPSQEEIDALFRASRAPRAGKPESASSKKFVRCDFRQAGQISKEQVRAVSTLHATFAAHVTNSLGAYLRVGLDVALVSVEQMAYADFLGRLPDDLTYLASVGIHPLEANALIQMDFSLAFPIIDLVLGGLGKGEMMDRAITEIEEQILESVILMLNRELQATWNTVLNLEFRFGRHELIQQVTGLMLSSEKVLVLSFEVRMPEASGLLNIAFPAVVSNALLRKLATQWEHTKPSASSANRERLRHRLMSTRFPVELSLPGTPVRMEKLLELEPGKILVLHHRVADPVRLAVSGKDMFLASPVSCGAQRGAQVVASLPMASNSSKE
jgi:flagellar motor switch protein FliM